MAAGSHLNASTEPPAALVNPGNLYVLVPNRARWIILFRESVFCGTEASATLLTLLPFFRDCSCFLSTLAWSPSVAICVLVCLSN